MELELDSPLESTASDCATARPAANEPVGCLRVRLLCSCTRPIPILFLREQLSSQDFVVHVVGAEF
jgi:hypothetical protein